MLHVLALMAVAADPIVSTAWLESHLSDPKVRVICTGSEDEYKRAHIPGARFLEHMETVAAGHRLAPPETLARALASAGAADDSRIVLYGDSPMTTGWVFMTFAAIGHAADVSMLDGNIQAWQSEKRAVSTAAPPSANGKLTIKPAPDIIVDAPWVKKNLDAPGVKVLDVRTTDEWNRGHLPGATLVLWQDLFADRKLGTFKSTDDIRALLAKAGVAPGQQVVTYCAVGMRASLMYWAVRAAGLDARVYVGSWQDWSRDSGNPVAK